MNQKIRVHFLKSWRQRLNQCLKLPGAGWEELRCLAGQPFYLPAPPPCAGGRCARSLSASR